MDAAVIGNALIRCLGGEGEDIVQVAADSRRNTWLSVTDPMSRDNFLRLCSRDPEVSKDREDFFHKLKTDKAFSMALFVAVGQLLPDTFEVAEKDV